MIDSLLLELLSNGVAHDDAQEALAAAKLVAIYWSPEDELYIEAAAPEIDYWTDHQGSHCAQGVSVHALTYRGKTICRWSRRSQAGFGLDRNHPRHFAAVAADAENSRYLAVVRPVLDILGLDDLAPSVPGTNFRASTVEDSSSHESDLDYDLVLQIPLDLGAS